MRQRIKYTVMQCDFGQKMSTYMDEEGKQTTQGENFVKQSNDKESVWFVELISEHCGKVCLVNCWTFGSIYSF